MGATVKYELSEPDRERLATALGPGGVVSVRTAEGLVELPAQARAAVRHLLAQLAAGDALHLTPDEADLTTQQAANLLGVSRTYLVRLVDEGRIPSHRTGTHRRVRAGDLLAYRQSRVA